MRRAAPGLLALALLLTLHRTWPAGMNLSVSLSLQLLLLSFLWPPPPHEATSANVGARFFGALLLLASLTIPSALPLLWPLLGHAAQVSAAALPVTLAFSGTALIVTAMLIHRLAPGNPSADATGPAFTRAEGLLRRRRGRYGPLRASPHERAGRGALLLEAPHARFLVAVHSASGQEDGRWLVTLPGEAFLQEARALHAKPVVFARRGTLLRPTFLHEVLLEVPFTVIFGDADEMLGATAALAEMANAGSGGADAAVPASHARRVPAGLRGRRRNTGAAHTTASRPTDTDPAETQAQQAGRALEHQQIAEVQRHLPRGWKLRANVILHHGGDADLELTRPDRRVFVVDVKLRRDDPTDARSGDARAAGEHRKTWAQLCAQANLAGRQLRGQGLVWQPLAPQRERHAYGVTVVGGSAADLLALLARLP